MGMEMLGRGQETANHTKMYEKPDRNHDFVSSYLNILFF